jgi:hydroxymethylglutaryl-CoA lyase
VTERLLQMGCYEVSLGDTIGVGTPTTTNAMLEAALLASDAGPDKLAVHFHDTL